MMGKTHIAVGIATAYMVLQPKTVSEFAVATVGGSIGGVMADIDVKIDRSTGRSLKASIDALCAEILAIAISVCALVVDYYLGGNVTSRVAAHLPSALTGLVMLAILAVLGKLSKHRGRTHSLVALVVFSGSVFLIDASVGIAFFAGYCSHLLLDLLNKKPLRLLYPLKKGFCFKLYSVDGFADKMLLISGVCCMVLYTVLCIQIPL